MDEERGPDEAQLVALFVLAIELAAEVEGHLRWLWRRLWLLRGILLMNVVFGAWNASRLDTETGSIAALAALGMLGNVLGAWKCLRVEVDFQGDIKQARARLRAVQQKIERVRNENRA